MSPSGSKWLGCLRLFQAWVVWLSDNSQQTAFFAGVSSLATHEHSGGHSHGSFSKPFQETFTFRIGTCFLRLCGLCGADGKPEKAGFSGIVSYEQLWANCSQLECGWHITVPSRPPCMHPVVPGLAPFTCLPPLGFLSSTTPAGGRGGTTNIWLHLALSTLLRGWLLAPHWLAPGYRRLEWQRLGGLLMGLSCVW